MQVSQLTVFAEVSLLKVYRISELACLTDIVLPKVMNAPVGRMRGMKIIGLTGQGGGRLAKLADVCIRVPETVTYKVQELHLPIYHFLCIAVEKTFFSC